MTFLNLNLLPIILIVSIGFIFLYLRLNNQFYNWIKDHWFFDRSKSNKISELFFLIGIVLLLFSLLDLRGKEENIQGKTNSQKTVILVDSSSSMLAEDVRPNRFKKALLLVKHFVKKAIGQQIAIVVFSDSTKRIVPFTDDLDLIEARINTIDSLNLRRGGTALSLAIQESVQLFKEKSDDEKDSTSTGNILIFTDAEETEDVLALDIPDNITVGVIGVGTAKGSTIPVRDNRGNFSHNKRFKGADVVSKLDEKFLKKLEGKIKNYKYWIATSYSIPTEEILRFFTKIHKLKESENSFKIRPVKANFLIIPGVVFIIISLLFRRRKMLRVVQCFILVIFTSNINTVKADNNEDGPKKSEKTIELENRFIENKLDEEGKKALAAQLLKEGFSKEAEILYEEIITNKTVSKTNLIDRFNQATAKIKNKKIKEGLDDYKDIQNFIENNSNINKELSENIKKNIIKAFEENQGGGSGKNDQENEDQENQNNKDNQKGDKGNNKDQKNKDQSNKNDDQKNNENNKDKKDQDKKNDSKDNKKNEKENDPKDQSDKKGNKDKASNEESDKKPSKPKKLPAILKQLKNQDNQLQKKLIDAQTTKRKASDKKDW